MSSHPPAALLLSAAYEPLRVVTWQRAFTLVFQGKVEVLEEYTVCVRTVSTMFRVPAVLKLVRWIQFARRPPVIRFSRANLYARDEWRCQYCFKRYPERSLTLDHVLPVARGGKKTWTNIVTACLKCNQKKGHRTPEEAGLTLLKEPCVPRWLPGTIGAFHAKTPPAAWLPYLTILSQSES